MTVINQAELETLSTLDQVLLWSIVSINASNLDARNNYISDNAAIRAESKDYIQWSVVRDDYYRGRFVFSALLPIVNPHPLADKDSIVEKIWSYSPYDPSMVVEIGVQGYGWEKPTFPSWVDTTERLLAYCGILASKISKYARFTSGSNAFWANVAPIYWAECNYSISDTPYGGEMLITGYLTLDWARYLDGKSLIRCLNPAVGHGSDVSCNFPDLRLLWGIPEIDFSLSYEEMVPVIPVIGGVAPILIAVENSAQSLIDSYGGASFTDQAVPSWLKDAQDSYQNQSDVFNNKSADVGNLTPKLVESLPVCKEQDPDMSSFAISLADKVKI